MAQNDKEKAPAKGAASNDQTQGPGETPAPTPPATKEETHDLISRDEAIAMANSAAERAVERALAVFQAGAASVAAPAQQPTIQVVGTPAQKPNLPGRTEVPKEHWSDAPLTVFHSGDQFCMDGFRIDGRIEPPPRSKLIMFKAHSGAEVKRFGNAEMITYTCKYTTHDKREIELFKQDVGWGTEYWDGSGRLKLDAQMELGMLMGNKLNSLNGVGFDSLKRMSIDRGLQVGSIQFMAANIAAFDSMKESKELAEKAASRMRDAEAENKLVKEAVAAEA